MDKIFQSSAELVSPTFSNEKPNKSFLSDLEAICSNAHNTWT